MSAGRLTTHVLDTMNGRPGAGMVVDLYRIEREERSLVKTVTTNADGRVDGPLLEGEALQRGTFELVFHVGHYFKLLALDLPSPLFLDEVPVRFGIADAEARYHVPLLVSPFGYTTYRGS